MTLVKFEITRTENPKSEKRSGKGKPDLCALQNQQCDSSPANSWPVQGSILRIL
ncbi:hypothetical protein PL336_03680 [Sulfitobacter faviae]|uniref:Uncharacterized protein n=1 Tax=Sulfitobacter faviae TaxID=1775881 RepID=A0AAX3LQU8_9RHOB|nr:hypothetical protein [Sulfitobacter faviae]WCE70950.1 hypothetical protein PL336_03680 [Sulfitobacter faviae]